MPRGGRRQGRSGTAYPNRSDLQTPKIGPSQVYGETSTLQKDLRDVPITPQTAAPAPTAPTPSAGGPGAAPQQTLADAAANLPDMYAQGADHPAALFTAPQSASLPPPPPLVQAVAALNSIGDGGVPELAALRAQLNASVANQNAP